MIRRLFVLSVLVLSTGCTLKSRTETPTTAYDYSGYDVYGRPVDADRHAIGDQSGSGEMRAPRSVGALAAHTEPEPARLE